MSHVDTSSPITHVSLCAGYGGIDLGLRRVLPALRTIAYAEREGFCCANLVSKAEAGLMDAAPIWTDVKTFPWAEFHGCVDILSGGYPCQPFSAAGKRLGAEDPRHLWPHISAGIALMRPSVCFFENVEGHISLGLPNVIEDLVGLGYKPTWCVASASEVGAPHQRKRVFILAYRDGERGQLPDWWRVAAEQMPVGYGETWRDDAMANAGGDQQLPWPRRDLEHNTIQPAQCNDGHRHSAAAVADPQAGQQDADNQRAHGQARCQAWPSRPGALADSNSNQPSAQRGDDGEVRSLSQTQRQSEHGAAVSGGNCFDAPAVWPSRPGEQQFAWEPPRVVANTERCRGEEPKLQHTNLPSEPSGCGDEAMGNAAEQRCEGSRRANDPRGSTHRPAEPDRSCANGTMEPQQRQTQPPLGRDADGPADWLDHAELYTTCDNRTDELRLLGNGVVPACAERAFRVLVGELMEHQP